MRNKTFIMDWLKWTLIGLLIVSVFSLITPICMIVLPLVEVVFWFAQAHKDNQSENV